MYNIKSISKFLAFTVGPNNSHIGVEDLNKIQLKEKNKDLSDIKQEVLNIFKQEIESYNIKDGEKIGVLLSGGLDSTLLLELLVKNFPKSQFYTYTLGYKKDDEHLFISKEISKLYNTIHREIIYDLDVNLFSILDDIYSNGYELEGEDSLIMNHVLAKEVKKDCNIVFSGFGLDYIFGGMDLFVNSFMEKLYNLQLIDKKFILRKLGMNKFYLQYVLEKFKLEEDFFIKYGEYYGDLLKDELQTSVKDFFYDSMNNIRDDISSLKQQIYFIISTSLSNRYRPYNEPYNKLGITHYNPFGSINTIEKIIALNIDDKLLLNPYNMEKKFLIREIFKEVVKGDINKNIHSGTVLKYDSAIQNNKKEIFQLIKQNEEFLSQFFTKDFFPKLENMIENSIWYENSKQIIILLQLLFFIKHN